MTEHEHSRTEQNRTMAQTVDTRIRNYFAQENEERKKKKDEEKMKN
jgi:hypothetical protein